MPPAAEHPGFGRFRTVEQEDTMNHKRGPSEAEREPNPTLGIRYVSAAKRSARQAEEDFEALLAAASRALQTAAAEKRPNPAEKVSEEPLP
jgi:hypothetical protein